MCAYSTVNRRGTDLYRADQTYESLEILSCCANRIPQGACWYESRLKKSGEGENLRLSSLVLTARGYTGDGFYGRGQSLSTGLTEQREIPDEELPENLCGGAYRKAKTADESRKRKRTYAERQQIRKERLFGKGEGESLGADQEKRMLLEKGKGKGKKAVAVKPRVAQSQRGRDLRAEAALRRLEASKAEASTSAKREQVSAGVKDEEISTDESATEDEQGTVDLGGGNKYVKLEDDDDLQENWKDIRSEVAGLVLAGSPSRAKASTSGRATTPHNNKAPAIMDSSDTERDSDSETAPTPPPPSSQERVNEVQCTNGYTAAGGSTGDTEEESDGDVPARIAAPRPSTSARRSPTLMPSKAEDLDGHSGLPLPPALGATLGADEIACPACTTANGVENILCMVCSCVLDTDRTASWKCTSKFCAGGAFAASPLLLQVRA